jgi:hypothetical protein
LDGSAAASPHTEGAQKRFKGPKAVDSTRRHSFLPHSVQGRKELKTTLAAGLKNGTLEKTLGTIVTHVKADLEETHHSPLPGVPNVEGFRVARTRGTTQRIQRFERRGLYA